MEVLRLNGITKQFSGVKVLHSVDFAVEEGEIHALLGANGAGKSTMMNIITGATEATEGTVYICGKQVNSQDLGRNGNVAMVHQELCLVPTMTVLQNIFLGREIKKNGLLDMTAMRNRYSEICREFNFDIDPDRLVREMSIADRQVVEILAALSFEAKLIIFDEPTTALTDKERKNLFEIILRLKQKGKSIIYISHIISEIFALADRASFLRNGHFVGTYPVSELTIESISEYMSGAKAAKFGKKASFCDAKAEPILVVENLCRDKAVNNVSFHVQPGEILGLAGLVGSGRTEIVRALFGADRMTEGNVKIAGKSVKIKCPVNAIKNGICMISEDRKNEGLILRHPIYKNAVITNLKRIKDHGLCSDEKAKEYMAESGKKLSIAMQSVNDLAESLSGGNQQKVVLSKWLLSDMKLFMFDEPTKGIDILAKEDVFKVIQSLAEQKKGIIFISSDLEEVFRISDRVLVISDGRIIDNLDNNNLSQKDIMDRILQYQEKKKDEGETA